jgi:hypothetical protein
MPTTFADYQKVVDDIVSAKVSWDAWSDGHSNKAAYEVDRDKAAQSLFALVASAMTPLHITPSDTSPPSSPEPLKSSAS